MSTESAAVSAFSVRSPSDGGQSMTIKSYVRRARASAFLRTRSRSNRSIISISAPTKLMWLGTTSRNGISVWSVASSAATLPVSTS